MDQKTRHPGDRCEDARVGTHPIGKPLGKDPSGLRIVEVPVPLIYLEESRSFGGSLDDGRRRLEYYHEVLDRAVAATPLPKQVVPCQPR